MSFNDYTKPKNGTKFKGIGVARISRDIQNEKSWEDQEAFYREWLDRTYGCENYELRVIAYQGSGQILDHAEFLELCDLVATGSYDFVIAEDLSRIIRRLQAVIFCEEAEAFGTRVVGIGDPVDTAIEGWEYAAVFTSLKNKAFCKDTARRIRRTLRNRFSNGEIVMCLQYGYIKPHPGASDEEVQKDPEATAVYEKWISMLEDGATYAEVARMLVSENIPTGTYCTSKKWTVAMVKRLTYNPILKGERHRNKKKVRRKQNGRPECVAAPPEELLIRQVPHLAFVEPDRWDRLIRQLDERNKKYRRSAERKNDPRAGIPKRRTRFPGQLCRCGVCGRLFVFGGHGKKDRLMCNGVREYECWNAMTVSGPDVATAISTQIREFIKNMQGFESVEVDEYERQRKLFADKSDGQMKELAKKLASTERKLSNQLEGLELMGASVAIVNRIKELEAEALRLKDRIAVLENEAKANPKLPSLEAIKKESDQVFTDLALDSVEFANVMRKAIIDMYVLPYRLVDGGHVQPRIVFSVALASFLPDKHPDLPLLRFEGVVDLAKQPVRVVIREEVVAMVEQKMKHGAIAEKLGVTKTEVGNAMALHRYMLADNVSDPWVALTSEEQVRDYFKRVRNPRFKFQPLEGFEVTKHPQD